MSDVSLKDHLETQIRWIDRYFEEKVKAMNQAVDKAAAAVDHRLAGMNEWRASLNDLSSRMATKEDTNKIEERIKTLEIGAAQGQGKATVWSVVWAVVSSIAVGLVMKFWH